MKLTHRLLAVLFFLVAGCLSPAHTLAQTNPSKGEQRLIVYYFHGNFRCQKCKAMETYTREALETGFPTLLKSGRIDFQLTNMDNDENEHFVNDFQLSTRSVVVAEFENGKQLRWKRLDRIWDLVGEKNSFLAYIQSEVGSWLSGTK